MSDQVKPAENSGQQEEKEERNQAQIDYDQGKTFVENNDPTLAAAAFHNALMGYEEQGDEKGIAKASDQLGDICAGREENQKAMEHYQRSLAICDKLGDPFSLLLLKKKMVKVLRVTKKNEEAVKLYMDILDTYSANNNPAGAVELLEDLSSLYLETGERVKAADALRTAASIHANFKHARLAAKLEEKAQQLEAGGE